MSEGFTYCACGVADHIDHLCPITHKRRISALESERDALKTELEVKRSQVGRLTQDFNEARAQGLTDYGKISALTASTAALVKALEEGVELLLEWSADNHRPYTQTKLWIESVAALQSHRDAMGSQSSDNCEQ